MEVGRGIKPKKSRNAACHKAQLRLRVERFREVVKAEGKGRD